MYKIILSVRLFHVSWGHNHDVEIMKKAIKVNNDVQKLINIFNQEKKGIPHFGANTKTIK